MTPKQRFITALEQGIPDRVPTFELEFQLAPELMGRDFLHEEQLNGLSPKEVDRAIHENAEYILKVYERLEHDAICLHYLSDEHMFDTVRIIRELTGDKYMLLCHGDGTYAISDAKGMEKMSCMMVDEPEEAEAVAEDMCQRAIDHNRRFLDHGFDGFILCSDYCFNKGPFISPRMFSRFVTPYLYRIVEDIRARGGYAIKHTDGDISKILDDLISCHPHALHSLDPMAGVDIRQIKEYTRGKVALCGNVHCAALQTGTEEDVIASAEYCLKYAKPGGGYIYCTSNVPFRGLKLERYLLVLDVWKKHRDY
ncbi:MAG: hypothetical protein IK140_07425 [Clostridia bacterium]|nr:hypothetical protein [Clostridia bacterium]MBR5752802.1 hypothetical protein [Clostridia bacterium]